jgi:hypothetical protein
MQPAGPQQHNEASNELIMSRGLQSFSDMSLKVVAVRTADNSNFGFAFPASGPQSTPSTLTTPLEQPDQRRRDRRAENQGWHHGGINE